jgi:cyclophilin family peptidyl-prolyl cis-trans isomerase
VQKVTSPSDILKQLAVSTLAAATLLTSVASDVPPATAGMLSADPVKNANALLRYALPIDNKPIRRIQKELEQISEDLRIPGSKSLGPIAKRVRFAASTLDKEEKSIRASFASGSVKEGDAAISKLRNGLSEFRTLIDNEDKQEVPIKQQEVLSYVGDVEQAMVGGFPFEVPSEYANLPQLKGRASLEMKITFKDPREDNATGGLFKIVVDGYNAPVSAGDFVDLANKGFYNGMEIQRADGFVVQTGKPSNGEGYVENGEVRRIPFEVMVEGDKVPVYEETLEDNGRYNEQPVLPFNAFGTLAMARSEFETNSASSQIFFLLKESELTPTGSNLLDGRYAVFGYITQGSELLKEMQVGDKIEYCKVVSGLENLVVPKRSAPPVSDSATPAE